MNNNLFAKFNEFKKNPLDKTLDWSINAINQSPTQKSTNLLFRLLIICLRKFSMNFLSFAFIIFLFYFLCLENKIIPIMYYNCRNKHSDNIEIDKIINSFIYF